MIKVNIKGILEFTHVLKDLGIGEPSHEQLGQIFKAQYLERLEQINNVYEDNGEDSAINQKFSKKHPLDMSLADEQLIVTNPRLVDVDWQI